MRPFFLFCFLFILTSCNSQLSEDIARSIGLGESTNSIAPTVLTISPDSYGVKGGTLVTITGTNFDSSATVAIGGTTCADPVVISSTDLTCTIGYHFASVTDVVVSNSNGITGTLFNGFSYNSFLFASNQSGSPSLTRLKIDSATGSITTLGTTPAPAGAYAVEVDVTNTWVYTAGASANAIGGYTIDHATGDLTTITGSPFAGGAGVNGIGISKDSKCLIASNWSGGAGAKVTSYSINQTTGALTKVADYTGGTNPGGIGIDPNNRFVFVANYGSNNLSSYTLDTTTCTLAFVGSYSSGSSPDAVAVHPSGRFVYTGNAGAGVNGAVTAMSINQSTGELSLIATYTTSDATNGSGVEIDKTGTQLYVTARGGGVAGAGRVWGYDIASNNGALTGISQWTTNDGPNDVRILGSGNYVFTANTESDTITVFSRDLATGNLTLATPSYYNIGQQPGVIGITF